MTKLTQYTALTTTYTHTETNMILQHVVLWASDRDSVYDDWQNFMIVSSAELYTCNNAQISCICKMHNERVNGQKLFDGMGETLKVLDFVQILISSGKWSSKAIRKEHTA